MQFGPGIRLGSYEVIAPVAAGGMGEVYRARDTMLGRDVAIKVLTHAADPASRARFEREARAVAALSHPNILAIYTFGYQEGVVYAVIEWLEGNTLREELEQAPLAVRRATSLGVQIALGLAAAHDEGVVHRDLKPENIFVTSRGVVKLLDFGLAKIAATSPAAFPPEEAGAETLTGAGMLLGSVGYMSPEQVVGTPADVRADVFALGIVLFEMLTGHSPFRRESAVETLNATLKESPPSIASFTPAVPVPLERIVMRCLEKSPAERFQSARDLAFALSALAAPESSLGGEVVAASPQVPRRRPWLVAVSAALLALLLAAPLAWSRYWATVAAHSGPVISFTITPPAGTTLANVPAKMLAISPDGDRIVFAVTKAGHRELWTRHLASTKVDPLPGTRDASEPFWSPDGQHVGFFADSKLKRVSIDGSLSVTVCDAPFEPRGAAWNRAGTILFTDAYGGLSRVAATGGDPTRVTRPAWESSHETDSWPQFLPDGRQFLYLRESGAGSGTGATVYVASLDSGDARPLLSGVFNALFVPPGVLVFADSRAVKVQRVDIERGRMIGDIEELSIEVDRHLGHAALAVSRSGTLAYAAAGSHDHRLVWVDRRGRETGTVASDDGWRDAVLSPDGSHVAVQRIVPDANDIWTIDVARAVPSRFTFSPDADDDPVWSPDGTTVAFSSSRDGVPGIYERSLGRSGDDTLVYTNQRPIHPSAWSPDGQFLLFDQINPASASDVWVLPMRSDRAPYPYLATSFSESDAHFSPDGKWVAYESDESGRGEIYVQSFPDPHEKLQISTDGGASPRWAPSGRELYFLSADRRLMSVKMALASPLQAGAPMALFDTPIGLGSNRYAPAHSGERFLLSVDTPEREAASVIVVLNWAEHLATTQAGR